MLQKKMKQKKRRRHHQWNRRKTYLWQNHVLDQCVAAATVLVVVQTSKVTLQIERPRVCRKKKLVINYSKYIRGKLAFFLVFFSNELMVHNTCQIKQGEHLVHINFFRSFLHIFMNSKWSNVLQYNYFNLQINLKIDFDIRVIMSFMYGVLIKIFKLATIMFSIS